MLTKEQIKSLHRPEASYVLVFFVCVVEVAFVVDEVRRTTNQHESQSRENRTDLVSWEEMSSHNVSHKHDEQHRNGPKAPAFPDGDGDAEERYDSADSCYVGYSFAKIDLVVHDSFERQDESDVDGQDRVDRETQQKQIQKQSFVSLQTYLLTPL